MDAELKAKWTAALRSGEYKQGRGLFENEDEEKFCCLGVLCVVAEKPTSHLGCGNWPFVQSVLAVDDSGWRVADKLAAMNDNGAGFPVIADYIDANL